MGDDQGSRQAYTFLHQGRAVATEIGCPTHPPTFAPGPRHAALLAGDQKKPRKQQAPALQTKPSSASVEKHSRGPVWQGGVWVGATLGGLRRARRGRRSDEAEADHGVVLQHHLQLAGRGGGHWAKQGVVPGVGPVPTKSLDGCGCLQCAPRVCQPR